MIAENFRLLVKTLIKRDNQYLAIQRSEREKSNPYKWDLPGGKLAFGEDIVDAINREVLEEVNVKVDNIKPIFTTTFMQDEIFVVAIIFVSDYLSGEVKLSNEHSDFKWLPYDKLNSVEFQDWIIPSFEHLNKL